MVDLPRVFRSILPGAGGEQGSERVQSVGVIEGAIGGPERFASVAALFPNVTFEPLGATWPDRPASRLDIILVGVAASSSVEVANAIRWLKSGHAGAQVVVTLSDADVTTTRLLMREGAADVLPSPVSEPALALCLERLLANRPAPSAPSRSTGKVVAVLKAGGGVGATSIAVQLAVQLAERGHGQVCLADLDLQFGAASLYLDMPEAVTVADCLSSDSGLEETPFGTALATHRTGVRLLAAPREIVALETLSPAHAQALTSALRRDFALTLIDLPSVWTAWTSQILSLADQILIVTHLSVPHVQQVNRQLRVLALQGLASRPVTLICNSLSPDQTAAVSLKAAERAMGRPFDVVIPEDRRTMRAATNQGLAIASVRRGAKVEKAIAELADKIAEVAPVMAARNRR